MIRKAKLRTHDQIHSCLLSVPFTLALWFYQIFYYYNYQLMIFLVPITRILRDPDQSP